MYLFFTPYVLVSFKIKLPVNIGIYKSILVNMTTIQHYLHQTQNFQISLEYEESGFLKENACGL